VTWERLLEAKRIHPHRTSSQELEDLRAVVDRDLRDAALDGLSDDRRFATAYNAILQLAKMAIACAGYRVSSRQENHKITIAALELALGKSSSALIDYFETCRRKRNALDYDLANIVSETESKELLGKAQGFKETIENWIAKTYPQFARDNRR
jgi:hypothetical protein